jgi:hypothetical protein
MANVPPPPTLVVNAHDPALQRRRYLLVALLWLASMIVAAALAHYLRERFTSSSASVALDRSYLDNAQLQQRIAILERSEQVARAANADLQQSLHDRQEEIAGLRADLGFFSRLTGSTRREGLTVQGVHLQGAGESRVYNFTITLTQNLKAGEVAAGHVRVSISGVKENKLATLGWDDVAPDQDHAGVAFSFKYFQQLKGALMLPEGFAPNRIHIEADAGGDMGRADQDVAWTDALATSEISDVQQ